VLWICIGALLVAPCRIAAGADDLMKAAGQLRPVYAGRLRELATWCDGQGLTEQARATRAWSVSPGPSMLIIPEMPSAVGPPQPPAGASEAVIQWHHRFYALRYAQATALNELAKRSVGDSRSWLTFDLIRQSLRENPDHEGLRRLLGYEQHEGRWRTAYEIRKLRSGQAWHARFGWLPKAYVEKYEQGMRRFKSRWITAEEDARLHADILSGWEIETEHFSIRTNHGIEAGVALGVKLERLYRAWQQLFIRYYATPTEIRAMFTGRGTIPRTRATRHHVVYFRNRDDYNRGLRTGVPEVERTIGMYLGDTRRMYTFAGHEDAERTLYHEVTHQLFQESRPVRSRGNDRRNFWIYEGVALYMESFTAGDGYYTLGGLDDVRLNAARYRLLKDGFYIPLAEFTQYTAKRIQSDPKIATLYSQAAGLTHFLIHYEGGRYRDAVVDYLTAFYNGKDAPDTLSRLTGTSYAELDRQYRQFAERGY